SVEPGLWGQLVAGSHFKGVKLYVRKAAGEKEYLTYTLGMVYVASFTTSSDGSGAPQDTIVLRVGSVKESYWTQNADGTLRTTRIGLGYDLVNNTLSSAMETSSGGAILHSPAPFGPPDIGLTLVSGGVTNPELEVESYSWGATNQGGTGRSLQDVTLHLAP